MISKVVLTKKQLITSHTDLWSDPCDVNGVKSYLKPLSGIVFDVLSV